MESGERLRPGDLAITNNPRAGTPMLGADVLVQIVEKPKNWGSTECYAVCKFPFDTEPAPRAVADGWLTLFWRPDAA